jgi:hypothetical protein
MTQGLAHPGVATRRPLSAWIWFGLMTGGWATFFALLLFSETRLADLWSGLRDLPLLIEGLVWFLLFPFVLATAVWESSWGAWLRVALVICFVVGWTLAFLPRKKVTTVDR